MGNCLSCCGVGVYSDEETAPIVEEPDAEHPSLPASPGTTLSLAQMPQPGQVPASGAHVSHKPVEPDDMTRGKKLFNSSPKKGILFLQEKGLLESTPAAIAAFLREPFLDKRSIGDYLGDPAELNQAVLGALCQSIDFTKMTFDLALRKFLDLFRLPGEAQKIDRIVEKFSKHYCDQNPDIFSNADTAYILAFSLIMLNTDLHNPNIKHHMTKEAFIKNNKGINNGQDLPASLLSSLYDSFKREELKFTQGLSFVDTSFTFFNPDREGYLYKLSSNHMNWQKRYFVTNGSVLYYFKQAEDKQPSAIIPLESLAVREVDTMGGMLDLDLKEKFCFELHDPKKQGKKHHETIKAVKISKGTMTKSSHASYIFAAETAEERNEWIKCIRANMAPPPIYRLRQLKKDKMQPLTIDTSSVTEMELSVPDSSSDQPESSHANDGTGLPPHEESSTTSVAESSPAKAAVGPKGDQTPIRIKLPLPSTRFDSPSRTPEVRSSSSDDSRLPSSAIMDPSFWASPPASATLSLPGLASFARTSSNGSARSSANSAIDSSAPLPPPNMPLSGYALGHSLSHSSPSLPTEEDPSLVPLSSLASLNLSAPRLLTTYDGSTASPKARASSEGSRVSVRTLSQGVEKQAPTISEQPSQNIEAELYEANPARTPTMFAIGTSSGYHQLDSPPKSPRTLDAS